ncbi:hypothetical protein FOZ63_027549 [Perkinsus olseni]|uniref:Uncharacterized protein n=1 Tax=Perkinsus olseni TaxID=32597 RepID=A0A7J6QCV7_PEROL|nr:hypothetical protein FOZ62_030000 [Perkinsus olseni]KAF4723608.1 hypothetical protein FOZ63_027549 [Perkinsus olseni]
MSSKEDDIKEPGEGDRLLSAKAEEIPMKEINMSDKLPGPTVAAIDYLRYGDGCELKVVTQSDDPRRPWKHHIAFERAPGGKLKPVFVTCEKRSAEMIPEGKDFTELLEGFAESKTADSCLLIFDQLFNRALDINKGLRDAIGSDGGETLQRFPQTRPFLGMRPFPKAYKPVYADEWRSYHFGKMLCDYIYHDAPLKDDRK